MAATLTQDLIQNGLRGGIKKASQNGAENLIQVAEYTAQRVVLDVAIVVAMKLFGGTNDRLFLGNPPRAMVRTRWV